MNSPISLPRNRIADIEACFLTDVYGMSFGNGLHVLKKVPLNCEQSDIDVSNHKCQCFSAVALTNPYRARAQITLCAAHLPHSHFLHIGSNLDP